MILDQIIVEVIKPIKLMPKKVSVTTNVKVIHHNNQTIQTLGKSIFYLSFSSKNYER